jgi:hypothetical protein
LTIDQFGSAIRLAKRLEKLNLNPEQIESFLDNIDEHCFKKGTETEVFVKKVVDVSNLSSKTKVPVEQLPSDIEKKKRESLLLGMEITMKTLDLEILYDKYNITEMQLREFAMNRPVIEGLQTTERNLAVVTAQRNAAYMEICQLRDRLDFEEYAIALRKMNATNEGKSRS